MVVKEGLPEQVTEWPEQAIVPLDGSSLSETVLPHVLEFGKAGTRITLLRVCEPPVLLADYPDTSMPENWEEHSRLAQKGAEQTCAAYLEDFAKERLVKEGIRANAEVILADRAANGIIDYANKDSSALIMMSTHGQSGLSLFPYGHVADRILLGCGNPILLVRTQKSTGGRGKAGDSSSG
jgi:nucleotide-binding universal stress UspA family protein